MKSFLAFFVLAVAFAALADCRQTVIIKNPASKLVLTEGADNKVTVNTFEPHSQRQQWRLEQTRKGTFFLVNHGSGNVVEKSLENEFVRTAKLDECKDQQWYIDSDKTIVNAEHKKYLYIQDANAQSGSPVIAFEGAESPNQFFAIEYP